jgi:hypothetical protein
MLTYETALQATVEATIGACRNLPFPNSYAVVVVEGGAGAGGGAGGSEAQRTKTQV